MSKGSKPVTNTTATSESNVLSSVLKLVNEVPYAREGAITIRIIPMTIVFRVDFIYNFYVVICYKIIVSLNPSQFFGSWFMRC
jgi:hypothetical protein